MSTRGLDLMMRTTMTSDIEKRWNVRLVRAEKGNWAWTPKRAGTSNIDGVSKRKGR
jgi:hypothetical protein